MKKLFSIVGPTSVGKSFIAMELSKMLPIEIVSCDSRQIYKYMDIGTAKPSKEDLKAVKHHMIDVITPDKRYNAKRFSVDAGKIIELLYQRQKVPVVVGGTGMYLNALIYGLFDEIEIPDDLSKELRSTETGELFNRLKCLDTIAASRLNKNDRYRIIRALEVFIVTGRSIFELRKEHSPQYDAVYFYIIKDRGELYGNINERVETMIRAGLIEEIQWLLDNGYNFESPGLKTVGYKEFKDYFTGECTLDDVIKEIQKNTRNYAKRQFTWFNKQIKKGKHYIINISDIKYSDAVSLIFDVIKKGID